MTWAADDPQGNEAQKVRFDVLPYIGKNGLDLGCGPNKVFPHFVGIDSGVDTKLFGTPMKPDLTLPDCAHLEVFADGVFDCVFSSHLLEHIVDYRAALAEWWRVVKVGGSLILYLPHKDLYPNIGQPGSNPDHKHDFVNDDIVAAMTELGDWDLVVNEVRGAAREYSFLQVYRRLPAGAGQAHHWREPKPMKTAAVVRPGAYGDGLQASSPIAALKAQGYHVTVYASDSVVEVLAEDPNIDRVIPIVMGWMTDAAWLDFFRGEAKKYDRFVNLAGVVESRLLAHPTEYPHQWSHVVRHANMNRNYLEALHDHAEVPRNFAQRFYPTAEEREWALARRAANPGPVVVLSPCGSGEPKTWPHAQRFMEIMADRGVYCLVFGDLRQPLTDVEPYAQVAGRAIPIRHAMAMAQVADVVVGTESAIVNAVAMEANRKVVLLMHSSAENLTKHWVNTIGVESPSVACYPCHRLHATMEHCTRDASTGFAACQSSISAEQVAALIAPTLDALQPHARAA